MCNIWIEARLDLIHLREDQSAQESCVSDGQPKGLDL